MFTRPVLERKVRHRAAAKYRLRLPAIFHWDDGSEHTECGFTNEVSVDGALIVCSKCPPIGSNVRVEVLLPSPDSDAGDIRIECKGKVICIQDHVACSTFGVQGIFSDDELTSSQAF